MKITPVSGVPNIQQQSATGLSPEKIQRLKTIARGEKPEEVAESQESHALGDSQRHNVRKIKMNTNMTPEQGLAQALVDKTAAPQQVEGTDGPTPIMPVALDAVEPVISDTGVQATPAVESTKQISPQLAALAKRERALQVKERELAEKEKLSGTQVQSLTSLKERATNGQALSVLEELGIPKDELYQRLTDEILGNKSGNTDALVAKIAQLEKSIDERLAKKDSDQEQAVLDHMSRNIGILARTRPDFRLIKESGSEADVLALIKNTWKETGEVLDEEEACKAIETELREDAKRYAGILGELEPKAPAPVVQAEQPSRFKTLTNKDSARPVMGRRQRAIAAALGQK